MVLLDLNNKEDVIEMRLENHWVERGIALLEDDHHNIVSNVPFPFHTLKIILLKRKKRSNMEPNIIRYHHDI